MLRTGFLAWVTLATLCGVHPGWSDTPGKPLLMPGSCDTRSYIARGKPNEDLTKHQQAFACDVAVVLNFNGDPSHLLIQFGQSGAGQNGFLSYLGFAGYLGDQNMFKVERIYLAPGHATPADVGHCLFHSNGQKLDGIVCGARFDAGGLRTLSLVTFHVAP